MKKYRLKEEVKKYIHKEIYTDKVSDLYNWNKNGLTLEALEEVYQRVELSWYGSEVRSSNGIQKYPLEPFSDQERAICEAALNGELFFTVEIYEILRIHNERPPFVLDTDYKWAVDTYLKQKK